MHHVDAFVGCGKRVGEHPGAVRAVIVDDEDVGIWKGLQDALDDAFKFLELVEKGHDDECALAGRRGYFINRSQEMGKVQSAVFVRGAVTTS